MKPFYENSLKWWAPVTTDQSEVARIVKHLLNGAVVSINRNHCLQSYQKTVRYILQKKFAHVGRESNGGKCRVSYIYLNQERRKAAEKFVEKHFKPVDTN